LRRLPLKGDKMKSIYLVIKAIFILLISFSISSAQLSSGGIPYSFNKSISTDFETKLMPQIDIGRLLAEDEVDEANGIPYRFGSATNVKYDLYNSGDWTELPDGAGLWRLRIVSNGAYSINLLYSQFHLPKGAKLFIYNENQDMVIGAFTNQNNKSYNEFATAPVRGDVTILEYFEPADTRGAGFLTISSVIHGYKDIFNFGGTHNDKDYGESGDCIININCPEGDPWQVEKRGVALIILWNGTRLCTGSLVNNAREDLTPYFLTAKHCLGGEATWTFLFNYESPVCENVDGPTYQTVQGATFRAGYAETDFALIEISEYPPDSFNVYYNGWSNDDDPWQNSAIIHHPRGDIKKISIDSDYVRSTGYGEETHGDGFWRIVQLDSGATENGSSGSPIFDNNHLMRGQLSGSSSACDDPGSEWFGSISESWYSSTPSTGLMSWLDPDNTGITAVGGLDPADDVTIIHTSLSNTYITDADYEIICFVKSFESLIPDSLILHYQTASEWHTQLLTSTDNEDQYRAHIPAQPAGIEISYYITAWDIADRADTTQLCDFYIEYSPDIDVTSISLNHTVNPGDSTKDRFFIFNSGTAELDYLIEINMTQYWHDSVSSPFQWVTSIPESGSILASDSASIEIKINTCELEPGNYNAELIIHNNDPNPQDSLITFPIKLTITDYLSNICGDVDNDYIVNILDITFMINFLYKNGEEPLSFWAADPDGNGLTNIIDITYLISYLYKGGPEPVCSL